MNNKSHRIILAGIILIAIALRLTGIQYDLPFIFHPDEPNYIAIILRIFKTGDLNPHFFNYPSFFLYINALAYIPYYFIGKIIGLYHMRADLAYPVSIVMGSTWISDPGLVLVSRSVTMLFGVASVFLANAVGKLLSGKSSVGLFAAFLLAISPTNILHSQYVTPDTFACFFASASILVVLYLYRDGKTWQYIAAGLLIGFTASSKYNAALVILPFLLAHVFRYGRTAWKEPKIYLGLVFIGLGFVLITPYSLLDFANFFKDLRSEATHYATGHMGMEGKTLQWYLTYMLQTGGVIYLFSFFEMVRGLITRSKETLILSVFPLFYFPFISSFAVRNDRTFLPLTPFLMVLCSSFIMYLLLEASPGSYHMAGTASSPFSWLKSSLQKIPKKDRLLIFAAVLTITIAVPLYHSISNAVILKTNHSRTDANAWIKANIPNQTKIAIESYAPFVDPQAYRVTGLFKMTDHEAAWFEENGYQYLVFSRIMYGRFFEDPDLYHNEIDKYNQLFQQLEKVREFQDGLTTILIYKVPQTGN